MIKDKTSFKLSYLASLILLSSGCYGVQSNYSSSILNNEKICIYVNIENNAQRIFNKTLTENWHVSTIPNCDYLLVATLYSNNIKISNASGVRLENNVMMTANYNIYKYNIQNKNKIDNILNNLDLRDFQQYTSGKNASMSKGSGVTITEHMENILEMQGILRVYNGTTNKLGSILEPVGNGSVNASSSYAIHDVLLTNSNQGLYDTEQQLAQYLANDVMENVVFDIIDFKIEKQKQQCRKYYDKFIHIDLSKYVKTDAETDKPSNDEFDTMTKEDKQKLEQLCSKEFKIYKKEKEQRKQQELQIHNERKIKEQERRIEIEKSGSRREIEELKLQMNKKNNISKSKPNQQTIVKKQTTNSIRQTIDKNKK